MWDTHLDLCHASLRCLSNLAEVQGIEPSTLRWRGFQDRLSTLLAYLQKLLLGLLLLCFKRRLAC